MEALTFKDFKVNKTFDFGYITLTEEDIMEYAKLHDPLDFHINMDAAKESLFKGLVSSGPQPYSVFHKTHFLPLFKNTILGGLEIDYKFLKAVRPNKKVYATMKITKIRANRKKRYAIVSWRCKIINSKGNLMQLISMKIIHSIDK